MDTLKASTSGYDGSDNIVHHDVIHVLRLVRKYYFDDACLFFIKDIDNYFFYSASTSTSYYSIWEDLQPQEDE